MAKREADIRLGEAKEMAAAWEAFERGDVRAARTLAKGVVTSAAAEGAKREAGDLLSRANADASHAYVAILVGCVWAVAIALVYFR